MARTWTSMLVAWRLTRVGVGDAIRLPFPLLVRQNACLQSIMQDNAKMA